MHIQGYGSPAVEAATAFDFGFQFAAARVLADLHGWNAPKKVAPTNPKGDGPAVRAPNQPQDRQGRIIARGLREPGVGEQHEIDVPAARPAIPADDSLERRYIGFQQRKPLTY
jgi:hypothetical protein